MLKTAVVGATGVVGQQFAVALAGHPWFSVQALVASPRSAGKPYRDALRDASTGASRWFLAEQPPEEMLGINVVSSDDFDASGYDLVFSAVESDLAKVLEPRYGAVAPVFTTSSAMRYEADTPLLIPGVNNHHAPLIKRQQRERGWKGYVLPNPNCTTIGLAITLKPLQDAFGLNSVIMTSLQGLSGAGRSPGVSAIDILDNVVPFIPKEEEKVQTETQKILGTLANDTITPLSMAVSCTCTRVNVMDGHTESVFVSLGREASLEEIKQVWCDYTGNIAGLPMAPNRFITIHDDPYRPQPRLDRDADNGMTTSVGRLRQDNALPNGVKYVLVSHNTKMGAARGAVLTAEVVKKQGLLG